MRLEGFRGEDNFADSNIDLDLEKFVSEVKRIKGTLAIYVFGSYSTGKMHELSDVDVCVVGDFSLQEREDILFGEFSDLFDISFLKDLPIWIKIRVLGEGKVLFVRNELALNLIKKNVLSEYLDFKPVIDDVLRVELKNV